MLPMRKTILIVFILITVVSVSLVSYSVYLLYGAYDVGRLLYVSVSSIEIGSGSEVSIEIYLLFNNTSKFPLQLVYVAGYVYLNGQPLTPHYAPATLDAYSNPIILSPFSETPVGPIGVRDVPSDKVPMESPKNWFIKLYFFVHDVPLIGAGSYTRGIIYP